jgi:hypothetical protein
MANKKIKLGGTIATLALVSVVTVGAITGFAIYSWPQIDPKIMGDLQNGQLEVLAKSTAKLSAKEIMDAPDPDALAFGLEKMAKDIRSDFPAISELTVLDDKGVTLYSTRDGEAGKVYQVPAGIKLGVGDKLAIQALTPDKTWLSAPASVGKEKKVVGGVRMLVSTPAVKGAASGNKNMVVVVGLAAMLVGVLVPVLMLSAVAKQLAATVVAPGVAKPVDEGKVQALRAEESALNARLEAAKKEMAKADEMKSQQTALEQQLEMLHKQQFEETYKLEGMKKEATELASHIEQRRQMMEASPQERIANMTKEDEDLLAKIDNHRKEELLLAKKIEEIRKKVIDLDRRVETRRKEEQEISARIEARKQEERDLSQRIASQQSGT